MDGEINSNHIPGGDLNRPMWRSIARWLEKPCSQFQQRYLGDVRTAVPVLLASQMDNAYALLMDCPSFNGMLVQTPELEDMNVFFGDVGDKDYDGMYNHASRSVLMDVSEEVAHPEYGLLPHFFSNGSHEYRHAFQYAVRRGTYATANPHILTLQTFVYEADANAFQCTVAYEAKELLGLDMFWNFCVLRKGNIASAFAEVTDEDMIAFFTGEAQQAAFMAFFENESKMNFYAGHTMEQLAERMNITPYEAAAQMFAHERTKTTMRDAQRAVKALPRPGQQFKAVNVPPRDAPKQWTDGCAMGFADLGKDQVRGRYAYGQFDDMDPKSVDHFLRGLSDSRYAELLKMNKEIIKFETQVSIELAKMRDRYQHPFKTPEV